MKRIIFPLLFAAILIPFGPVSAQTLFWTLSSKDDVLKGDSRGAAIDDTGRISAAPAITTKFATGEQFVWSSVIDRSGNLFLGTGGEGKVFKVGPNGKGDVVLDTDEINVSALAAAPDGTIYAGTSPDGKVYQISPGGKADVYFEPGAKYIWSLAVGQDGSLFVGTGETGKIYKVNKAGADSETSLFYDSRETHIICLAVDSKGDIYAGTDSSGLVLRIGRDKKAFAVLDSSLREIHELSIGPDGSVYVLALSESASAKSEAPEDPAEKEDVTVTVERSDPATVPTPPAPDKSRYDLAESKSAVYRILPSGTEDVIWNSSTITGFSIAADPAGNGVFLGTSEKGRIFRVSDSARETLIIQTEEEQISTLRPHGGEIVATTSNKGSSFRFGKASEAEGTYESPVLDAKSTAVWGRIWAQKEGAVTLETRAGNSARPGETWSEWVAATASDGKIASPNARYLQWRAKFGRGSGTVGETTVSFSTSNIAPEILMIEVLPPNVGLAPNPEVVLDPNIETLGLNPTDFGLAMAPVPPRRVFQTGARSIQWQAEDRNGDRLLYTVFLSRAGTGEFRQIGSPSTSEFITLDGLTLDDGKYIVKIVADDSQDNKAGSVLRGERISEAFEIDNTPPSVTIIGDPQTAGKTLTLRFRAEEKSSYIKRAEYSINGGKWQPAFADDGIVDGKTESFTVNVTLPESERFFVSIRVFDAVGNIGAARYMR